MANHQKFLNQLKSWDVARLIPTLPESKREERATSILLATFRVVPAFALDMLKEAGSPTGKRVCGYLRSRWSSELLALELARRSGVEVHATTVRRWLARLEYRYRRARPTLHRRDPRKAQRLQAIEAALADEDPYTEVFFVDEADVDLNPRIGSAWMRRGEQTAVPTPGQNQKHYIAGALHADTGRVVWVEHERKNSVLFVKLLEQLRSQYRRAKHIVLIVDNYRIHSSRLVERWLERNRKFQLLFQPAYHPWVNVIKRLWKAMHDTVTRNHRCRSMFKLCQHVARFLDVVQPFPGSGHGVAHLRSAI